MKKIFYTAAVAAIALGLTACGGKKEEAKNIADGPETNLALTAENSNDVKPQIPETVTVSVSDGNFEDGDMAEYVAIVPGEYTFYYSNGKAKIELMAKVLAQADKRISSNSTFEIYDADGNKLGIMFPYGGTSNLSKAIKEGDTENEFPLEMYYYGSSTEFPEFMTKAKEIKPKTADEYVDSSSSSSSGSSSSDSSLVNDSELSKFISDGKSGDIDKMLSAFEWLNKTEAGLKSQVRALNENAIKAAIEIDKANEEIGEKYDAYSLMGALNNMTDKMSSSQLSKYNSACGNSVLYFTSKDDTSEYNSLYRKLRYGSIF